MTTPGTRDLTVYRGNVYRHIVKFVEADANGVPLDPEVPISQVGATWRAQVRADPDSPTVAATFTFDTADAATGVIVASLPGAQTALLTRDRYVWDLERIDTDETLLAGEITVIRDVSRD